MFMKFMLCALIALFVTPAIAADTTIEMLNKDADGNKMVFTQALLCLEFPNLPQN